MRLVNPLRLLSAIGVCDSHSDSNRCDCDLQLEHAKDVARTCLQLLLIHEPWDIGKEQVGASGQLQLRVCATWEPHGQQVCCPHGGGCSAGRNLGPGAASPILHVLPSQIAVVLVQLHMLQHLV